MSNWIETSNGNRISKQANICNPQSILIAGMCVVEENCTIDGNVNLLDGSSTTISMGRFCLIESGCLLRPPVFGYNIDKKTGKRFLIHHSLVMSSYILIKSNAKIHCKKMGTRVIVGQNAILSRYCTIGDVVIIEDNVTIPENCHVPSFSKVKRHPDWSNSVSFQPLNGSMRGIIETWCRDHYLGINIDFNI